jgi:membrane protease YdiL (CAAX protease family)
MNRPSSAALGVGFLVGTMVLAVVPVVVHDLLGRSGFGLESAPARLEAAMVGLVVAAAVVLLLARGLPPAWPFRPGRLLAVLRTYLPFAVLWVGFLVGYLALARALGQSLAPQAPLRYLAEAGLGRPLGLVVVLGLVVAAPVAEEVVFRGFLQGALANVLPPRLGLVVTAVVFGLLHQLPYALPVAGLGLLFGWLVWRHGSLLPAILAHALHNGLTVLATLCWPAHLDWLYPR